MDFWDSLSETANHTQLYTIVDICTRFGTHFTRLTAFSRSLWITHMILLGLDCTLFSIALDSKQYFVLYGSSEWTVLLLSLSNFQRWLPILLRPFPFLHRTPILHRTLLLPWLISNACTIHRCWLLHSDMTKIFHHSDCTPYLGVVQTLTQIYW